MSPSQHQFELSGCACAREDFSMTAAHLLLYSAFNIRIYPEYLNLLHVSGTLAGKID